MSTIDDFEILRAIGKGSYGTVYKVRRKIDNRIYVIKQINISGMSKQQQLETVNEVNILAALNNEYIIKYYDSFIDARRNILNIVMEYAEHGTLFEKITQYVRPLLIINFNRNKEEENYQRKPFGNILFKFALDCIVCTIFRKLLNLDIHNCRILHRDIKSLNIFLDKDDNVKIGDFGVSKILEHTLAMARTQVGTPYYLSPELCENKPYGDIWALGCILYEMCTFKPPFDANNQGALILKIIKGRYPPINGRVSSDLIYMVNWCLNRNANMRPYTYEILAHPSVVSMSQTLGIALPNKDERPKSEQSENKNVQGDIKRISPPLINKPKIHIIKKRDLQPKPNLERNIDQQPIVSNIAKLPPKKAPVQHFIPKKGRAKKAAAVALEKQREIEAVRNLPDTIEIKKRIAMAKERKKEIKLSKWKDTEELEKQFEMELKLAKKEKIEKNKEKLQNKKEENENIKKEEIKEIPKETPPVKIEEQKVEVQEKEIPIKEVTENKEIQEEPKLIPAEAIVVHEKQEDTEFIVLHEKEEYTEAIVVNEKPEEKKMGSVKVNIDSYIESPNIEIPENEQPIQWKITDQPTLPEVVQENNSQKEEPETVMQSEVIQLDQSTHIEESSNKIHEKSKPRMIDRLLNKVEDHEKEIAKLIAEGREKISEKTFDEILNFFKTSIFVNTVPEEEKNKRIQNFVFGRIKYENAEIVSMIYQIHDLEKKIEVAQKQIVNLIESKNE